MLKAKNYRLLEEAIDEGIAFGLTKLLELEQFGKLVPSELENSFRSSALANISHEILAAIDERFHIEDEYEDR